jgi:hypothetical protein
MADFITQRQRDAWGSIRGYVYQVDATIERWLALSPDGVLELERGDKRHSKVAVATMNRELATLRRILYLAHEWNEIPAVPTERGRIVS